MPVSRHVAPEERAVEHDPAIVCRHHNRSEPARHASGPIGVPDDRFKKLTIRDGDVNGNATAHGADSHKSDRMGTICQIRTTLFPRGLSAAHNVAYRSSRSKTPNCLNIIPPILASTKVSHVSCPSAPFFEILDWSKSKTGNSHAFE